MSNLIVPGGRPEATPAPEEPGPPAPVEVVTAFVVYLLPDSRVMVSDDLNAPLVPGRKPSGDELYYMSAIVMKDVQNTEAANMAANAVVGFQEMRMRQAMEAQQNAQLQRQLEADARKPAGRR